MNEHPSFMSLPVNPLGILNGDALTFQQLAAVASMSNDVSILGTRQQDLVDLRSNFASILFNGGSQNYNGGKESDLLTLVQSYDWEGSLRRVVSHPKEASKVGVEGRTALHLACDHDAPAIVVHYILAANPSAALEVGTSNMNPLHITCSSQHASVHIVRVLLSGSDKVGITAMKDVDGDTCLHTGCRCGAPIEVLELLLRANPSVVHDRDYEGLTPLLRLWVRYFVTLGDDVINSVTGPSDLVGDLREAWDKTTLLFRAAYHGHLDGSIDQFRILDAAASIDCPRFVVKLAATLHPEQLAQKNEFGKTPLIIASKAPIYKEHDLSDEGYYIEDLIHGDLDENNAARFEQKSDQSDVQHPSVIEILLDANKSVAHVTDSNGRLPLNIAICAGKHWNEGIKSLLAANPDALMLPDIKTGLFPFMLAAIPTVFETSKNHDTDNKSTSTADTAMLHTIYELLRANPEVIRWTVKYDENNNPSTKDNKLRQQPISYETENSKTQRKN